MFVLAFGANLFVLGAQLVAMTLNAMFYPAPGRTVGLGAMISAGRVGSVVGPLVTGAVSIPVLGGFGGGPWLDGRVRMAHAAIGYAAAGIDDPPDTYAQVAGIALDALSAYAEDVRAGRQIKGGLPVADRGR